MLHDPRGTYELARIRHAELYAEASRQRDLAHLRPLAAWRTVSASALRRLADRMEGMCADCATPTSLMEHK
jgi:hypothetical protein